MKNLLIGYGETLTSKVTVKSGPVNKKHPYSVDEARERFQKGLSTIIEDIQNKPAEECASGKVVVKFTQHPSYLAKSYYPKALFSYFGMKDIGSKPTFVKPERWAVQKHPEEGLSSCIYVSGTKEQYSALLEKVESGDLNKNVLENIQTIENISTFTGKEKIKSLIDKGNKLKLEVVIHASSSDKMILSSFREYLDHVEGLAEFNKAKTVGGLTFLPVTIDKDNVEKLSNFSHLRVLRSLPKLRFNKPDVTRTTLNYSFSLPEVEPLRNDFEVCIFDGGLGSEHLIGNWAKEIIPKDVKKSHPGLLSHGSEVCSTYLFGPYDSETQSMGKPYTNVDIVRVLSPDDNDPDLFEILGRIESVLSEKKYKYINLSLGPQIPVEDDEVHVWTSVLDSYFQDGDCLATVAIGNDGDLDDELSRIQPPSDMVNSLAIGSCTTSKGKWQRSSYSCIGPGRSPGIIKPDGLMFGGEESNLFEVYSPLVDKIVGTAGTSYSAPYALRVAAGIDAITDIELMPTTIKALMIHSTERVEAQHDMKEVGWGRFPNSPEEVIECLDDEATIIFQGTLLPSQHMRIPVPIPETTDCTWTHIKATFSINTVTDPEHPLHYTRGGLDIAFRANNSKFTDTGEHPKTKPFFSCTNLYPTEEELRADAHKWETCISRSQRFKSSTLKSPMFDVKYHAREQGAAPSGTVDPIKYSLILTIRTEGDNSLYNNILQKHRTLQAIKVRSRIRV